MKSLWSLETDIKNRKSLDKNIKTDVAIVGAGLAGILTAYFLKQNGIDCVILEADRIAGGQTKNTTAKITLQHGIKYSSLIENFGFEKAMQYKEANSRAIEEYFKIAEENNIDCMLERLPAYLYTLASNDMLEKEFEAAKKVGIESEIVTETSLPFDVRCALRFDDQAQFDPLKFIDAISKDIEIYENTRVISAEENRLFTEKYTIEANKIVITSHFPFINSPGYYFIRMHQERSYILALENAAKLDGMYFGIDDDGLSFRNSGKYLLIGGGNHRTGENPKGGKYKILRDAALEYYPDSREAAYWSAQDCMPLDGVPYIGNYSSAAPDLYVATGFQKWGMTSSMVSAMILSDMIAGKENPYEIFSPQRFNFSAAAKSLADETVHSFKGLSAGIFSLPDETTADLQKGHGGIVEYNGEKVGVYKDADGKIYTVPAKCPHLGCELSWNPDEFTWDCPCHGSRFDYYGKLISGPSVKDLKFDDQKNEEE